MLVIIVRLTEKKYLVMLTEKNNTDTRNDNDDNSSNFKNYDGNSNNDKDNNCTYSKIIIITAFILILNNLIWS